MKMGHINETRRKFLSKTATYTGVGILASTLPTQASAYVAGADEINVALVGCGGRGTGAAAQAIQSDAAVRLVAMADVFDDQLQDSLKGLSMKFSASGQIKVTPETTFIGFDAYKKAIELSTGDVIFFLDSDDYFHQNKIEKIIDLFIKNDDRMIIFDFPILLKKNQKIIQKKNNNFFKTYWGFIHPTSCISIRKKFIKKVFDSILFDGFNNIWLDLRILLYSKYLHNYNILDEDSVRKSHELTHEVHSQVQLLYLSSVP